MKNALQQKIEDGRPMAAART